MKRLPWRSLLYGVILLYLFLDLRTCHGPLYQSIQSRRDPELARAKAERWVAVVNREPITSAHLDLAVDRHLFQRGKTRTDLPAKNLAPIRRSVLSHLIDETLIRQYADGEKFVAPADETERFVAAWEGQFSEPDLFAEVAAYHGTTPDEIRAELTRVWTRHRWLEQRIAPGVEVTDAEVSAWYEENKDSGEGFREPEKVRARHIFLSTVEVDDETRETLIRELHRKLTAGEATFDELARANSEDPRSKPRGGDLGWFARDRVPAEFAEVVFALPVGTLSEPFRSPLGWHIAEVIEHQAERPVTFDEVGEEIRVHLKNERTQETVAIFLKKLRTVANLKIFPENF